jgi:hypothetical protein
MAMPTRGRAALIVGASVLALFVAAVAAFAYLFLGLFHANEAQRGFQPIDDTLRSHGIHQVCHLGDAGYGPDNVAPWYQASYDVRETAGVKSIAEAASEKAGYTLEVLDTPADDPSVEFPSSTFQSSRDGRLLSVTVVADAAMNPDCSSGYRHSAGSSVVSFSLDYPSRHGTSVSPLSPQAPHPASATAWANAVGGTFQPVTVSGTGPQVIPLPSGAQAGIVAMSHPVGGEFTVTSGMTDARPGADLLVDSSGAYEGVAPFGLDQGSSPPTTLLVKADGAWTLTVEPLASAPAADYPLDGTGDRVYLAGEKVPVLTGVHHGGELFEVRKLTGHAPPEIDVFEPEGEFTGTVPLTSGYGLLVVSAHGSWKIG